MCVCLWFIKTLQPAVAVENVICVTYPIYVVPEDVRVYHRYGLQRHKCDKTDNPRHHQSTLLLQTQRDNKNQFHEYPSKHFVILHIL